MSPATLWPRWEVLLWNPLPKPYPGHIPPAPFNPIPPPPSGPGIFQSGTARSGDTAVRAVSGRVRLESPVFRCARAAASRRQSAPTTTQCSRKAFVLRSGRPGFSPASRIFVSRRSVPFGGGVSGIRVAFRILGGKFFWVRNGK